MAVPGEEMVRDLHGAISDAAVGVRPWLEITASLRDAFAVDMVSIELFDKKTGVARTVAEALPDVVMREYGERYFHINPRIHSWGAARLYAVYPERLLDPAIVARSGEFYDWVERHRLCRWIVGGPAIDDSDYIAHVVMQTTAAHGPPDEDMEAAWARLLPVIGNALEVERALAPRGEQAELLDLVAFDNGRAYALVDRSGRLLEVSTAFERLVEASGTLRVRNRQLEAARPEDRWRLEALLQAVLDPSPHRPALPLRIRPPAVGQGLLVRALPLAGSRELFERLRPAALLVLTDLDAPASAQTADLRAIWGLTEREADLALALAQGRRLEEAAALLGIGEGTARHHLKSIFRRMEIDRQADLVRLVAKLGG